MKAGIYRRVSSAAQSEEGTSLDTQEERCRAYCAEMGYAVAGVWTDVHTGADLHERRGLSALRELARAGRLDVIVAYAVDRLTRDQIHLGVLLDEADQHGVRYETVTEPLDLTPIGKAVLALRSMAAEIEREKIRERTMRGKAARLAAGHLPTWTCDLYGYRNIRVRKKDNPDSAERSRRTVNEDEAEIVRFVFRSVVEGISLGEISRVLNERGVPSPGVTRMRYRTPKTPRWHPSSMHHMIQNPAYKGMSVANRFTRRPFRNPETGKVNKTRQYERPESEWTYLPDDLTPAIVEPEVWELANQRLRKNRGAYPRNKHRPYLLRGLIRCAHCGSGMYSEQEGGKNQRRTYRCAKGKKGACEPRTRTIAEEIEAWAWAEVRYILRERDRVVAELRRRHAAGANLSLDTERGLLRERVEELTERQSGLLRREGSIPWALIEREVNRLEGEIAGVRGRLVEVEEGIRARENEALRVDGIVALIDKLSAGDPDSASLEERHRIVRDLGIEVRVSKRLWRLDWLVPIRGAVESDRHYRVDFEGMRVPDAEEWQGISRELWPEEMGAEGTGAAYRLA